MSMRMGIRSIALFAGLVGTVACGSEAPRSEMETESDAPIAAPMAPASESRVFFVEPEDGATVTSPVHLQFGIEDYGLEAVPQGTVPEESRAGVGHHHLGIDTECLPPGTVVPRPLPWAHYGGGQTEVDVQLSPGPHTLTLQLGDDLHQAIEGLCTTIEITVTE